MGHKYIYFFTLFTNVILIIFGLALCFAPYGRGTLYALLLCLPPFLSLIYITEISGGPDTEERKLAKRIRKANMRKELKSLSEFDA